MIYACQSTYNVEVVRDERHSGSSVSREACSRSRPSLEPLLLLYAVHCSSAVYMTNRAAGFPSSRLPVALVRDLLLEHKTTIPIENLLPGPCSVQAREIKNWRNDHDGPIVSPGGE